jgi:hypothetical protein
MQTRVRPNVLLKLTSLCLYFYKKKTCFNTNNFDLLFLSIVVSLLREFEGMFSRDVPSGLSPIREIEY